MLATGCIELHKVCSSWLICVDILVKVFKSKNGIEIFKKKLT